VGHPNGAPQIPPLRFAPVGMTNRRGRFRGEGWGRTDKSVAGHEGHPSGTQQVPPLRFAPVGMTNRRGRFRGEGWGRTDKSVAGDELATALSLEPTPFPLSFCPASGLTVVARLPAFESITAWLVRFPGLLPGPGRRGWCWGRNERSLCRCGRPQTFRSSREAPAPCWFRFRTASGFR
jgi:hypothetical protein